MGSKSSPPPAPDPQALASADQQTAQYNTNLNRVNQYGPQGSSTWSVASDPNVQEPDWAAYARANPDIAGHGMTPEEHYTRYGQAEGRALPMTASQRWSQTTTLSPDQQRLYDLNNQISQNFLQTGVQGLNRASTAMGQQFDTSGLPALGRAQVPTEAGRNQVVQALMSRIEPDLARAEDATRTRLLNQGIEQGSAGWDHEMELAGRARNDALMQAQLAGGQEQSRLAGLDIAASGFNNTARQQGIQEQAYLRSLPLNEINALRTGSQASMPQFSGYYTGGQVGSGAANLTNAYNAQVGQTNASNAAAGQTAGTIGSLAALAAVAF